MAKNNKPKSPVVPRHQNGETRKPAPSNLSSVRPSERPLNRPAPTDISHQDYTGSDREPDLRKSS